ncbi:MAG: hypothetical protein ACYTG5_09740 [Planctomycetota bacterium]|jgi:hypothetical protein
MSARTWLFLGILILVGIPMATSMRLARKELRRGLPAGEDGFSVLVRRLTDLRADLPRLGEVGYMSDRPMGRMHRDLWVNDYHLVRYALRPLRVLPSTDAELIVGDFEDSELGRERAESEGLEIVRDYGEGVFLMRSR